MKEIYVHIDKQLVILYIHSFINFSITRDIKHDILNNNMDKKRFDKLVHEIYCTPPPTTTNSSDEISGGAIDQVAHQVALRMPQVEIVTGFDFRPMFTNIADFLSNNLTVTNVPSSMLQNIATTGAEFLSDYWVPATVAAATIIAAGAFFGIKRAQKQKKINYKLANYCNDPEYRNRSLFSLYYCSITSQPPPKDDDDDEEEPPKDEEGVAEEPPKDEEKVAE